MRIIALCFLALTIAVSAALPAGAPELEKLRASYKAAAARGTKPVLEAHIKTLEKLRDIYARGANLEGATKVQSDIDRVKVALVTGEFIPPAAESSNMSAPELDKLRAGNDANMERALKPYHETYLRELDKLRDTYTRSTNLASAMAVQEEIEAVKAGVTPGKEATLQGSDKQPRLSGKAPKPEWYIGKTWGGTPGASFTFAKGGGGEIHHTTGKIVPLKWEIMRSGVLKVECEASNKPDMVSTYIYFLGPAEGKIGFREDALDKSISVSLK